MYYSRSPYAIDTLGGKSEWANIQTVYDLEMESTGKKESKIIKKYDGVYLFLHRENNEVLILLNCIYPPYYKQYPHDRSFSITPDEFKLITQVDELTPTVRFIMRSHLSQLKQS